MVKNSDLMKGERGVTGEVHHLDAGCHVLGMKRRKAPDISISKH
jgi:enoyl-[acyl-carrier-protein] reductase (NADH)